MSLPIGTTVQWLDDGSALVYDGAGNVVGSIDTGGNYKGSLPVSSTLEGFYQDASSRLLDKIFGPRVVSNSAQLSAAAMPKPVSSSTMIGLAAFGLGTVLLIAVFASSKK